MQNNAETLESLSMGKIWQLARARKIEIKGKKKAQLMKEIIAADMTESDATPKPVVEEAKVEKPVRKYHPDFVEAVLADGTKIKVPAKDVLPAEKKKSSGEVTIKSVDGRTLEVSVNKDHWIGKTITVPADQEDEVRRLLDEGGFYFV